MNTAFLATEAGFQGMHPWCQLCVQTPFLGDTNDLRWGEEERTKIVLASLDFGENVAGP